MRIRVAALAGSVGFAWIADAYHDSGCAWAALALLIAFFVGIGHGQ